MKRVERKQLICYSWWRTSGEDIRPAHVGTLEEAAMDRINEMMAMGYQSGELCTDVRIDDSDGENGITYRGWWSVSEVDTHGGTRSTT